MKKAVIKTGGKQYVVSEKSRIKVEKLDAKEGDAVKFDEVLLTGTDKTVKLGDPVVVGATVEGKVLGQARHKKVWGVKMKAKKRNRVMYGHKQPYTEVEITKISTK